MAAAPNVPALLSRSSETRPDVVLLDIRMPPTYTNEGITAATTIRDRYPGVGVLVLSQYVDADYALQLIKPRPTHCGYLLKDRITEIDDPPRRDRSRQPRRYRHRPRTSEPAARRAGTTSRLAELTNREREVLELVAQGLTDRGISERLWLTPKTVETHIRHILAKLNLPADTTHNRRVLAVLTYLRTGNTETDHTHL